jgi:hypothetical protein
VRRSAIWRSSDAARTRSIEVIWSPFAEFMAWWLAIGLLAFVGFGPLRRDKSAAQAYLIAVALHVAAAAIYVYIPDVLPSRADASAFHKYAVLRQWSEGSDGFAIGSRLYEELLAYVYRLFGASYFLGSVLSIYAFALSVLVLVRFMELLHIQQGKGLVVLLFGAVPTAVLYGSVPMREPYQVLFFMLACYCLLRFRLSSQPLYLLAGTMFALMMGILHKGLIVYAPFLVIVMLLVRVDRPDAATASWFHVYLHRFVAVVLALGFVVGISTAEDRIREIGGAQLLLKATAADALVDHTSEARGDKALSDGRTAYGAALDTSTPVHLVYSSIMILTYYMFTPFPWQISHPRDLYALAESLLRMACLFAIFRMWRRGGPVNPQVVVLLMVVYFSMAFLWAAGTFTWGTATRHHMIHQWIVLMLGVPALLGARAARSGHGGPLAPPADPPDGSEPGGTTPRWRRAGRRGGAAIPVLRRLGGQRWQPRGLRTGAAAPRPLSGSFAALRRPTRP